MVRDYDYEIFFHPGKANIVGDNLSQCSTGESLRELCFWEVLLILILHIIVSCEKWRICLIMPSVSVL